MQEAAERLESSELIQLPATQEQLEQDDRSRDARLFAISAGLAMGNDLASKALDWWTVDETDLTLLVERIDPVLEKHSIEAPSWLVDYKEEIALARALGAIGFEQWRNREKWLEEQRAKKAKDVTPVKKDNDEVMQNG